MAMGAAGMQDNEVIGAVSSNYLNQFALVTLGYVWLREAQAVLEQPEDPSSVGRSYRRRVTSSSWYFRKRRCMRRRSRSGRGPMVDIDIDLL